MIDIEIPYWTWIQIKCPSCWYEWLPDSKKKWTTSLAMILYICWIFPGIIYSIWRGSSRTCCCPKCWQVNIKEINWDDELVNNLIKLNKIQNYAFVGAILLAMSVIFWLHDYKLSTQEQQKSSVNTISQQYSNTYQQDSNNINNTDPVIANKQEIKEEVVEIKEEQKNLEDEIREKMQDILKQIDHQYSEDIQHKVDSYIWASCSWDCIDWIINIKFKKNLWWESWVVESAAAIWNNNIIRAIPGYFDKLQINYICHDQTITSCTFTEYQTTTVVPKGCVSHQYKDTKDEAREKMQNILKEVDSQYLGVDWYIWTSCLGDCINWVININFSKDIWWWDFTIKSHAAMLNNKIIKAIPWFFDKLRISFIYNWQTVCSCIFTEYQSISTPKWCTYYWYKE